MEAGAKVTVVGDIYECKKLFYSMLKRIQPSANNLFVSVGNIYMKNSKRGDEIVDKIKQIGYTVRGNNEEKLLRKARKTNTKISDQLKWMGEQPLSIMFRFINGTRLTVLNGGVKPGHTWLDLKNNTDLLYISTLDENKEPIPLRWVDEILKPIKEGKVWHEYYDGRFGYIASGHDPQTDGIPQFYAYSCNLNTSCYTTGILSAQTFSENGREKLWQT